MSDDPIAEDWLRSVGFKWYHLDRQPSKHWLLWMEADDGPAFEDLGLELAKGYGDWWFCWLRSDTAHRYSRFVHVRHLRRQGEVISLVEALTGRSWDPTSHIFGCARTPAAAARYRAESDRLDRVSLRDGYPWRDIERDDSRGSALPEHLQYQADHYSTPSVQGLSSRLGHSSEADDSGATGV